MFSNLKAKKRITQLLIAVLVVALTATGSALLLNDFVQEAKAADYTVNNATDWSNAVTAGGTVNITLGSDLSVSSRLTAIPKGTTVNLYMNGKTIQYYNASSGNTGIMSTSYTLPETYWGIVTNNGTLNIRDTGTIASYQVGWNTKNDSGRENYGMRTAAIVNNGTLDVGSSITVKAFGGQANTEGTSYQDMVIYAIGIYNTGSVTSSGTIHAGTIAQGVSAGSTGSNSFISAFSYGIFGGNVVVSGGNIYSEAKSGLHENAAIPKQANQVGNYAVGVYSNNAIIYGNTKITTKATSWRDNDSNYNTWKNGHNMSWGVGVMYSGANYPVIGADVNISASYYLETDGTISFPEFNGETVLCSYSRTSSNGPETYGRKAYPVAGVSKELNAAMYGGQSSEIWEFDGNIYGSGTSGSPASSIYRSEFGYYNNSSATVTSSDNKSASGSNDGGVNTGSITMGAPGTNGGQFMVYYRYRDLAEKVTSASVTPNSAINSAVSVSPSNGVFSADQTSLSVSGGGVVNPNFYESLGTFYVAKGDGEYGTGVKYNNISDKTVTNKGTPFSGSFAMSAGKSYYIFADYKVKTPTNVKVVAANKGNTISYLTTSTTFEVPYTGNTIVPGSDFNLGVIDMKLDSDASIDDVTDNTDVTGSYAVSGTDSSKVQLVYSYSTDGGSTYKTGLPKDVGSYTIKVVVPSDTDINRAGAGNRNGGTFYLTCKITTATPSITGASTATGTYGSTIAELIPTSSYTIKGVGNETMTGTWSYSGYNATDYPEVGSGSQTVTLTWTPTGDCAKNYTSVSTSVTLSLSKRKVTVTPADSTVTYGAKSPSYVLNYSPDLTCDASKASAWLAASTFEVYYNGGWQEYSSTMLPGTYDMRIATFGGDTANNDFTTSGTSKLVINKAPLYYTATATNKDYDGVASVNVVLSNNNGLGVVNGDSYSATIETTGTLANANAGENKAVTVKTDGLKYDSDDKYYIAIQNNPSVTIYKISPNATAESQSVSYSSENSLSKITLKGQADVAGSWSWEDASIVPSVDVSTYIAEFRPDDTTNYNVVKVPVTINVSKTVVTVSVESQTISFADPAPTLTLKYDGFTGSDTEYNVATTGTIVASTTYSMGKSVGVYPITITMDEYASKNYEFVAATDCVITVEKKNVTVTAPSATVTYGDNAPTFSVTNLIVDADALYGTDSLVTLNDQAQFVITPAYNAGDSVGTYDVTVSSNETDNYTFTFVNGTVTVTKAVLTVTADNKTVDFGKQAPTLTYTFSGYKFPDTDAAPSGSPRLTTQYSSGSDAGEYAIDITVDSLYHPNYTFKVVGGTITVNKLTLDTTGVSINATITHDEAYSAAVFTDTSLTDANNVTASGTFALKNTDTIADYTVAEEDWLGKYVIATGIFTPTDAENYNAVEVEVRLYIELHSISGAPVITGTAMEGSEITVSVAGMSPSGIGNYTYKWFVAGSEKAEGISYTVAAADIGKAIYVIAYAEEDMGYTGSAKSSTVTAVEAFSKLADNLDLYDIVGANEVYTYNGATHGATVAVKNAYAGLVSNDITVYYNGSTTSPYKAGTYIVTIDVGVPTVPSGADRNDYYGPVSGLEIGTITINKAPVTATFTVEDKVYDGTKKVTNYNVLINGAVADDDVRLDISTIAITFNKAAAGEQKIDISAVKLVGEDIANYTLVIEDTYAKIEKAVLKAEAHGIKREYNGSAQVDVEFKNITGYAAIDSATTVYVESATATAASVDASEPKAWNITNIKPVLGGISANNYVLEITNEATAQVTITKATPKVTPPTVDGIRYNSTKTLAQIDLDEYYNRDANGYWQFDDTSIVPTVKKTQYAATYISQNNNYSNYSTNITVNVMPTEVTLTAVDTTVSYGKAASYSVKADGFTGSDSLATMGGTQPTYVCTYGAGENVGDYVIKINHNLDSNGNYTFKTVNGTLTVVKADLYVTATATDRDYNGSTGVEVKFAISSGKYGNDDVVLSTTTANGTASSANAGTRTVSYKAPSISGTKASNYNLVLTPASDILTVTIKKLNPEDVVFPTSATLEYGRDFSWTEFSDDAKGDGYFEIVGDMPNELGTFIYTVEYTPADSVNYNTLTANIPLTVTICTVTPVATVTGKVQSGEKLSVVFTGMPTKAYDFIQYQWYRVSDSQSIAIANATNATYTATDSDVGYKLVCVTYFDASAPFKYYDDILGQIGELEGFISEATGTVEEENLTFWQRIVKWIQSIIEALTGVLFLMGG